MRMNALSNPTEIRSESESQPCSKCLKLLFTAGNRLHPRIADNRIINKPRHQPHPRICCVNRKMTRCNQKMKRRTRDGDRDGEKNLSRRVRKHISHTQSKLGVRRAILTTAYRHILVRAESLNLTAKHGGQRLTEAVGRKCASYDVKASVIPSHF